jgi:hypothetical protein
MFKQIGNELLGLEKDGYAHLSGILSDREMCELASAVEKVRCSQSLPGLRNLLSKSIVVKIFAQRSVAFEIALQILGNNARPVRAILFDKTPDSNWYVTWHQDLSIPVKAKVEIEGYGPWTTKAGVAHVQPPSGILEKMISLRIHLDDCAVNNGAIKFIAGSHRLGILDHSRVAELRDSSEHSICSANRGDIIVMRPLILHSSSAAETPNKRRVLHLEYAGVNLPAGLQWAEA